jgi:hypothetical protein
MGIDTLCNPRTGDGIFDYLGDAATRECVVVAQRSAPDAKKDAVGGPVDGASVDEIL